MNIQINIKLLNEKCMPEKATLGSAGFDLRASIDSAVEIMPMTRLLIPAGFCIELPENYEAQIRSRSGLSIKNGICVLNAPGTIDSDYRQEVKVILMNFDQKSFVIEPYMRIAQMVINKIDNCILNNTEVKISNRGGFGSTGVL